MKILWLVLLHTALAQTGFGTSYLRDSRLCRQWKCLNTKLNLPDTLPSSEQFGTLLRSLLPSEWQGAVEGVLNTCYNDRPRRYSNTCPGQAIWHCAVDQLIANCPDSFQRKEDACAPINSIAGFHYLFSQSRYENIERNIAVEHRPPWFLRNYFNNKCCNVPALFNSTTLSECSFTNFIQYFVLNPTIPSPVFRPQGHFRALFPPSSSPSPTSPSPPNNGDSLQVVNLPDVLAENTPITTDPLDCCDVSDFIQPSWRQECGFQLTWEGQSRLAIKDETQEPTTTSRPVTRRDITVVPHTCEKETCVFSKLNIITNGTVDMDAFTRLLDNLTSSQPSWTKAKGRALTTCMRKPLAEYTDECEINKILACTFDVLTENCPNASKNDLCNHSMTERTCQISSSKYRPKHRRDICILPELVDRNILTECGLISLSKTKPVTTFVKPKTSSSVTLFSVRNKCKDLTPSTTCLLSKMGVLNKYGFVDYFKMKDRIRNATANREPTLEAIYLSAFNSDILYDGHCNSPKKLLNTLDSMLMTCPKIRSQNSEQCVTIFDQVSNSPINRKVSQEHTQRIINHFYHVYNPLKRTHKSFKPKHIRKIKKSPIYHYGILNDFNAPKVTTIDLKPKPKPLVEKPPLVLLPVYMRIPQSNLMIRRPFIENGVMRGFPLNNPTNNAHFFNPPFVTSTPVSTSPISAQRVSTIRPFSTIFKFPKDEKLDMLKPE